MISPERYYAEVTVWFAQPGRISTIDVQTYKKTYPNPYCWDWTWTQWDTACMPNGRLLSLMTTVSVYRSSDYTHHSYSGSASCFLWHNGGWKEINTVGGLHTLIAFQTGKANTAAPEIESEESQQAFHQDVERVRSMALKILAVDYCSFMKEVIQEEQPMNKEVTLRELRPGAVFVTADGAYAVGTYAVKSEYHYDAAPHQCLCVLLESGEFAHFPNGDQTHVREVKVEGFTPEEGAPKN